MGLHCDACLEDVDRDACYADMVFRAGLPTAEQAAVIGVAILEGRAAPGVMAIREDIIFCAECLAQSGLIDRVNGFIKWHQEKRAVQQSSSALTPADLDALGIALGIKES